MSDPEFTKKRYHFPPHTEAAIWQLQRALEHDGIRDAVFHYHGFNPSRASLFDDDVNQTYVEFDGRETFEIITRDYF